MLRRTLEFTTLQVVEANSRVDQRVGFAITAAHAYRIGRRGRSEREVDELGIEIGVVEAEQQALIWRPLRIDLETTDLRLTGVKQAADQNA